MKIVVAGASGLIGRALVPALQRANHKVLRLVRRPEAARDEIGWDPGRGVLDAARLVGADAVINLAGENVGGGRWTAERKEGIFQSRVDTTRTLVRAMAAIDPRPEVFINASAIGFYGDRGDEKLDELSPIGYGFLPEVCLASETHAEGAKRAGIRTVMLRLGIVLARNGGALAKMLLPFRLGLGGRLGHGKQWMSWIELDDAVGVIQHVLATPSCIGPLNAVAPQTVTNAEFTRTLARVLRRPAIVTVPESFLRFVFGQMADETLLASMRVSAERLVASEYKFQHPTLESALRAQLS